MPELPKSIILKSGVYCIRNKVTGKRYIGSAIDIRGRWKTHRTDLRRGVHDNSHLLRSWNKHGEGAFEFVVLQYCEPERCTDRENFWIVRFKANDHRYGYNIRKTAESNLGMKYTEDQRANLREVRRKQCEDPEWLRWNSKRMLKLWKHPESRRKYMEGRRKMAADPVWQANNKAAQSDPSTRAKKSRSSKLERMNGEAKTRRALLNMKRKLQREARERETGGG